MKTEELTLALLFIAGIVLNLIPQAFDRFYHKTPKANPPQNLTTSELELAMHRLYRSVQQGQHGS